MKTILIVSNHTGNWGAERSTCSLAAYLKSLGYKVVLVIPREGKIMELIKQYDLEYIVHYFRNWINYKGTNYFRALASSGINAIQLFLLICKLRKKNIKPDIIYSNTLVHGFGIALAGCYKVPHIQHIRENVDVFGIKFNWGYDNTIKIISKNSTKIICTSNALAQRYQSDIGANKITYVYNGIPISEHKEIPKNENDVFSVLLVGRLDGDKRPQDVFAAIHKMITNGYNNIHLDVYGTGALENTLLQYIREYKLENYISMKGYQSNIVYSPYYAGIMSATFEAFGRTTIEYMMNGLAVIGCNSGATKEIILHGVTGYLYKANDSDDLYKYLEELYLDREKCIEFGRNGRKRVVECFSQERYVKGVSNYFIKILNYKNEDVLNS